MGSYLIPGALSTIEAAAFVGAGQTFVPDRRWEQVEGGVLFTDPALDDAGCAALYQGFVPSAANDEVAKYPMPDNVRLHTQHLRDYLAADPATITAATTVHAVKDIIRVLFWLNRRVQDE